MPGGKKLHLLFRKFCLSAIEIQFLRLEQESILETERRCIT